VISWEPAPCGADGSETTGPNQLSGHPTSSDALARAGGPPPVLIGTCHNYPVGWGRLAQPEAPMPLLSESSSWDWLLSLGVVLVVVAALVAAAVYVVRSRRLAAHAIAEVDELRSSLCGSSDRPR
jgi:hypothetical protein